MFCVTRRAIGCRDLRGMMSRAIVAGEAGAIGGSCGKRFGLAQMAGGALFFQNGVGTRQAAAAVDVGIARQAFFCDPKESQQKEHKADPQFGALERRRPLEIIEVDALCESLCRARSRHNVFQANGRQLIANSSQPIQNGVRKTKHELNFNSAAPSQRERHRAKSAQAKAECALAASRGASGAVAPGERAGALRCKYLRDR